MSVLQIWYGLSDYEVDDHVNDSISFSYLCGLNMDEIAPDHSTLGRLRTALTKSDTHKLLLSEINRQLEALHVIVKT